MNPKNKNKRILNRVVSVLLTACMMVTSLSAPISVLAETVQTGDSVSSEVSGGVVAVDSGEALVSDELDGDNFSSSGDDTDASAETSSETDSVGSEEADSNSASSESDVTSSDDNSSSEEDSSSSDENTSSESSEITDSDSSDNSSDSESASDSSEEQDASSSSGEDSSSNSEGDDSSATDDSVSSDTESTENDVSSDGANTDSGTDSEETEDVDSESTESTDSDSESTESEEENKAEENEEFTVLGVVMPESEIINAEIGDEVTFTSELNRDDVEVSYQWQRIQVKPVGGISSETTLYDYSENHPTYYSFKLEEMTESEYLKTYPDATWQGIEMYFAIMGALEDIGEDSSNVRIAWKTKNYIVEGYAISAANTGDRVEIYADKDGQRSVGTLNEEGEWEFGEEEAYTSSWENIEGATEPAYTFIVGEADFSAFYRCVVTILDEEYIETFNDFFSKQETVSEEVNEEISENTEVVAEESSELIVEQNKEHILYSPSMSVESVQIVVEDEAALEAVVLVENRATVGFPQLSADVQWITGLTSSYEYITKDTYDRVSEWLRKGEITQEQADRFWTRMLNAGWGGYTYANVLDANGFPTGETRYYNGFTLTDGKLEVNSEWYGKTVYFRMNVNGADYWNLTGTAIDIPAYTELSKDADGNYVESTSGSRYKKAISFLNPYVLDTGSVYKDYLELGYITTANSYSGGKGWVLDDNGRVTDNHIAVYAIDCESFNRDPQRYMVDAEGNYRMDSVGWGVCTYEEPDVSGKAYFLLKDYMSNGYGFIIGHDTMYAYAGSYYDAYGADLSDADIDPNDGTTWYHDIHSWRPTATSYNRNSKGEIVSVAGTSKLRGGHFYVNELMGSNAGNVYSGTVELSDSPSGVISTGGEHGKYGIIKMLHGGEELKIETNGSKSASEANANVKYRTPTNYPFAFYEGQTVKGANTHTNQQAAFGTIWAKYSNNSKYSWTIDGVTGTNNFYLTGEGNFLMNQIGHLPYNSATVGEAKLFTNSVFYVSQRKQCEVCAANQGQEDSHFVHRVNSANADEILSILSNGGNYWYPLNDCYMLVDDIKLPEDWIPIKNFSGHWNSDVYDVVLNSSGEPLFENTESPAEKYNAGADNGWNLGSDLLTGVENVFKTDDSGTRTTGIARVVGDLNDLFSTDMNYAGYTVKFFGNDNPGLLSSGTEYSCTVNSDSKYVVSNLPCTFNTNSKAGILKARVYDANGNEITQYGSIRANVPHSFWDTNMTTPLYLGGFSVYPVGNDKVYEGMKAAFTAITFADEEIVFEGWQYREKNSSTWNYLPDSWDYSTVNRVDSLTDIGDNKLELTLLLNNCNPEWNEYEFRAMFSSEHHGTWNTHEYWVNGSIASNSAVDGWKKMTISTDKEFGQLKVNLWEALATQGADKVVFEGDSATFTSTGFALADGGNISVEWEYGEVSWNSSTGKYEPAWKPVKGTTEFGGLEEIVTSSPVKKTNPSIDAVLQNSRWKDQTDFYDNAPFYEVESSISIYKIDIKQDTFHFRVHYTAVSPHGTVTEWYSNIADDMNYAWTTETGAFFDTPFKKDDFSNALTVQPPALNVVTQPASAYTDSAANEDVMTPDKYGQTLLLKKGASVAEDTAIYRALIYYHPQELKPTVSWQYRTLLDSAVKSWNQEEAEKLFPDSDIEIIVTNRDIGVAGAGSKYPGYYVIESTMTISNTPIEMYDSENYIKYFFRCFADTTYETVKEIKSINRADQWGGLTMNHDISIEHQGVFKYGNTNKLTNINGTDVTVNTLSEIAEQTKGAEYTTWAYPKLNIQVPLDAEGNPTRHINTAIVYFDGSEPYDSRNTIIYDSEWVSENGIKVSQADTHQIVFVSETKDTVELDTWKTLLRDYVKFTVFDTVDYTHMSEGKDGASEGAVVRWYVDELRLTGVTVNADSGKAYEVVDINTDILWNSAKNAAATYNEAIQTNGYLAEINDAEENEFIHGLLGDNTAWIGGFLADGERKWAASDELISYDNYKDGYSTDKPYLAMTGDGTWDFFEDEVHRDFDVTYEANHETEVGSGRSWSKTSGYINVAEDIAPFVNWYSVELKTSEITGDTAQGNNNDCFWEILKTPFHAAETLEIQKYYTGMGAKDVSYEENIEGGLSAVRLRVGNGATTYDYSFSGTLCSLRVKGSIPGRTDITRYVVEYDLPSLGMVTTSRSAEDSDRIGTQVKIPEIKGGTVSAIIVGNSKVYDGKEISPLDFVAFGENATPDLFTITYTVVTENSYSGYTTKVVSGKDWQDTGAINASIYHAKVELTEEAIAQGWKINTELSTLECDLIIRQRPVDVFSYNNDKMYDGTNKGEITNITMSAAEGDRGVIAGDSVVLNTPFVEGFYTEDGFTKTSHNSVTNSDTGVWEMIRNERKNDLYILHNEQSDPYHNYYLDKEVYSGAITQRPVTVHSLYLEDPENPRNVKEYDGTANAVISDIIIDNIIDGDDVGLKDEELSGVYEKAQAGEALNEDGTEKENRFANLVEYIITPDNSAELTGNDFNDYYIAKEEYSGAIARALLEAKIANWRGTYGTGMDEAVWASTEPYTSTVQKPSFDTWLTIGKLQGSDQLVLDKTKSDFIATGLTTPQVLPDTDVGIYSVTYNGLTENNYPVLSNYLVKVYDGMLKVEPREIVISVDSAEKMMETVNPDFSSSFQLREDDESLTELGSDAVKDYAEMLLCGDDTVANSILVRPVGSDSTEAIVKVDGKSNISYSTKCDVHSSAQYAARIDDTYYACEFCEEFYGTSYGTDHWKLVGYEVNVNTDKEADSILEIAYVTNSLGEQVQNYVLSYVPGEIVVHPYIRCNINVTVPLYVCMYGYGGDGEVVEPTNYGITNYSENLDVSITDIEVSKTGWDVVQNVNDLKRGEIYMNINGTPLKTGNNTPLNPDKWFIGMAQRIDETDEVVGQFLKLPMSCYIAGGNVNDDGCTYVTNIKYTVAADTSINKPGLEEYAVMYVVNGGKLPKEVVSKYNVDTETFSLPEPTRIGYVFSGWYENEFFNGNAVKEIVNGSEGDKVFFARWTPIPYPINYVLNGGTQNNSNVSTYTIEDIVMLQSPTRNGYTFSGWYADEAFSGDAIDKIAKGSYGNKNFYAKWTPIPYTITYHLNGGVQGSGEVKNYDAETATFNLPVPTKENYTFLGWYTAPNFSDSAVSQVTKGSYGNKDFYARWTPTPYPINYVLNGGTQNSSNKNSYTVEDIVTLQTPTRKGYTFNGWYTTENFSDGAVVQIGKGSTGSKTFYAKWTIDTYTIKYVLNNGTQGSGAKTSYTVETATFNLPTPTRSGYVFNGWYESSNFSTSKVTSIAKGSTGNKTFYAKWTVLETQVDWRSGVGISKSGTDPIVSGQGLGCVNVAGQSGSSDASIWKTVDTSLYKTLYIKGWYNEGGDGSYATVTVRSGNTTLWSTTCDASRGSYYYIDQTIDVSKYDSVTITYYAHSSGSGIWKWCQLIIQDTRLKG